MKNTAAGHAAAAFSAFVWGVTFVSSKVLLQDFTPGEVLFYRYLCGYLALWVAAPRILHTTSIRREIPFALAGICGIVLYNLLSTISLNHTLTANVGVITSSTPIFTALFAFFLLADERPAFSFAVGFCMAMAGIVLIATGGDETLAFHFQGDVLALVAAIAWGAYSIFARKIGAITRDNIAATRRIFFYGLLFLLPCLPFLGFRPGLERFVEPRNLVNILFLGLISSALCFATWNYAMEALGAVKASAYIYAIPVINIVAAMLILGEQLTFRAAVGAALTLVGLAISEMKFKKSERSTE